VTAVAIRLARHLLPAAVAVIDAQAVLSAHINTGCLWEWEHAGLMARSSVLHRRNWKAIIEGLTNNERLYVSPLGGGKMVFSLAFRSSLCKRYWPGREQREGHHGSADKIRFPRCPKIM